MSEITTISSHEFGCSQAECQGWTAEVFVGASHGNYGTPDRFVVVAYAPGRDPSTRRVWPMSADGKKIIPLRLPAPTIAVEAVLRAVMAGEPLPPPPTEILAA